MSVKTGSTPEFMETRVESSSLVELQHRSVTGAPNFPIARLGVMYRTFCHNHARCPSRCSPARRRKDLVQCSLAVDGALEVHPAIIGRGLLDEVDDLGRETAARVFANVEAISTLIDDLGGFLHEVPHQAVSPLPAAGEVAGVSSALLGLATQCEPKGQTPRLLIQLSSAG